MKYTVGMGEEFNPPQNGLAPDNYDPETMEVFLKPKGDEMWRQLAISPAWLKYYTYRLEKKVERTVRYRVVAADGSFDGRLPHLRRCIKDPSYSETARQGHIEYTYEGNRLVDVKFVPNPDFVGDVS